MRTLLILLVLLAAVAVVSFRFLTGNAALRPNGLLLSRLAAGALLLIGLGLIATMIHTFYFEP